MNGFMTLLTGALAILVLGLIVFLVGEDSYRDSFASQGPVASASSAQQEALVLELPEYGSGTCQEDGDVYQGKLETELPDTAAPVITGELEPDRLADSERFKDLKLPEDLSMNFAGTGEVCQ